MTTTPNYAPPLRHDSPEWVLRGQLAAHSFFTQVRPEHEQPMVDFILQQMAAARAAGDARQEPDGEPDALHLAAVDLAQKQHTRIGELESQIETMKRVQAQQAQAEPVAVWVRPNGVGSLGVAHFGPTCPSGWVAAAKPYYTRPQPAAPAEPAAPAIPTTQLEAAHRLIEAEAVGSTDELGFSAEDSPRVLDPCSGSRMMWFDRGHPDAVFGDRRRETLTVTDRSHGRADGTRTLTVNPDQLMDFRALPFPDCTFRLIAFDPPHLVRAGPRSWLAAKYGKLGQDWRDDLRQGFAECFRVLHPDGVLVFKWNETQVKLSEVLALTPHAPLFGNTSGKKAGTHWLVFMKPNTDFEEAYTHPQPAEPAIPGALKKLGKRLAELLDEDQWAECEVLLLATAQALAQPARESLEKAYRAGFEASDEGYNAEYPFGDHGQNPEHEEKWLKNRDEALASLAQPAAPATPPGIGGGLVAIKTLLSRDPCAHANVAIQMIDAMLAAAPAQPAQEGGAA